MNKNKSVSSGALLLKMAALCVLLLLAVGACLVFSTQDALILGALPSPEDSAREFFDALSRQDYDTCDEYITGYSSLGLDKAPQNAAAAKLYSELRSSYTCTVHDKYTIITGSNAQVTVELEYFSLEKAMQDMELYARTQIIDAMSEFSDEAEVYNDDGTYNAELYDEICMKIVDRIIEDKSDYMVTRKIVVSMKYSDGWRIVADEKLVDVLCGDILEN